MAEIWRTARHVDWISRVVPGSGYSLRWRRPPVDLSASDGGHACCRRRSLSTPVVRRPSTFGMHLGSGQEWLTVLSESERHVPADRPSGRVCKTVLRRALLLRGICRSPETIASATCNRSGDRVSG